MEAATKGAINAFVDQGFTEDVATDLVRDYIGLEVKNLEKSGDDEDPAF